MLEFAPLACDIRLGSILNLVPPTTPHIVFRIECRPAFALFVTCVKGRFKGDTVLVSLAIQHSIELTTNAVCGRPMMSRDQWGK